ncbi:MAG: hypothetical protein ACHQT8_05775 [Chlamydiales bacterium]
MLPVLNQNVQSGTTPVQQDNFFKKFSKLPNDCQIVILGGYLTNADRVKCRRVSKVWRERVGETLSHKEFLKLAPLITKSVEVRWPSFPAPSREQYPHFCFHYDADSNFLVAGGNDQAGIWGASTGGWLGSQLDRDSGKDYIHGVYCEGYQALSFDAQFIQIWNGLSQMTSATVEPFSRANLARVTASFKENYILCGSNRGNLALVEENGGEYVSLPFPDEHNRSINWLSLASKVHRCFSACDRSTVKGLSGQASQLKVWDLKQRSCLATLDILDCGSPVYNAKDNVLFAGTSEAIISQLDPSTGKKMRDFTQREKVESIFSLHYDAVKKWLFAGCRFGDRSVPNNGKIVVWSVKTGEQLYAFSSHNKDDGVFDQIDFDPCTHTFLTAGNSNNGVRLWDLSGKCIQNLFCDFRHPQTRWDPTRSTLVIFDRDPHRYHQALAVLSYGQKKENAKPESKDATKK